MTNFHLQPTTPEINSDLAETIDRIPKLVLPILASPNAKEDAPYSVKVAATVDELKHADLASLAALQGLDIISAPEQPIASRAAAEGIQLTPFGHQAALALRITGIQVS